MKCVPHKTCVPHQALLVLAGLLAGGVCLLAGGAGRTAACPEVPQRDPTAPFRGPSEARAVVVEYFVASQRGDAARAADLIDYEEWGKQMGLDRKQSRMWADQHRRSLEMEYDREKKAGGKKEFEILKETDEGGATVFEVLQERSTGMARWQIRLKRMKGRWRIVGFSRLGIED